jgi:hypothetical protein
MEVAVLDGILDAGFRFAALDLGGLESGAVRLRFVDVQPS